MKIFAFPILVTVLMHSYLLEARTHTDYVGHMRRERALLKAQSDKENCSSIGNGEKYNFVLQRLANYVALANNQFCKNAEDCTFSPSDDFISRKDKFKTISMCHIRMIQNALKDCSRQTPYFFPRLRVKQPSSLVCESGMCKAVFKGDSPNWQKITNKYWQNNELGNELDSACAEMSSNPLEGFKSGLGY